MNPLNSQKENWKFLAGSAAAELVQAGMFLGLGTGSTITHFLHALSTHLQNTNTVLAGVVSTSQATYDLAQSLGLPVTTLEQNPKLDLYIDGADEIDPQLRLIKGAGGALLREKVVASASSDFVVIADISKRVEQLGTLFPVPVEVVPFATTPVRLQIEALGARPILRQTSENIPFVTENHNLILDCFFPDGIENAEALDNSLQQIVGVVETGLFIKMASTALIGGPDGVVRLSTIHS